MKKIVDLSKKNSIIKYIIRILFFLFFFIYNLLIILFSFCRKFYSKNYRHLLKFKDKFKNNRCFIIAAGPSLTIEDLESLREEYTFSMNSIVKVFDETDFRPTFYGIQDKYVYRDLEEDIYSYYFNENNVFLSNRIARKYKVPKNWNIFPYNHVYNAYNRWFKEEFNCKFSDDSYKIVYDGFSITYSLVEIAVFMGFKEIYLLGADCSFSGSKVHFKDYGVVDDTIDTAKDRNIAGYIKIKEYCQQNGIEITNVTRGGELEVFTRKKLEEVLGVKEGREDKH